MSAPGSRMKSEERRELVLAAATGVFGERGYVGATTDAVARAAGVSQPYVVRMFGGKEALFLAVLDRALDRLLSAFRGAISGLAQRPGPEEGGDTADEACTASVAIARAYAELLSDRGLLLSLMHGFILGSDPVIGARARAGFLEVYRLLRDEAGFSADEAREFLSAGMLLNTMVGIRMTADYDRDPAAKELLDSVVPTKLDFLLSLEREAPED